MLKVFFKILVAIFLFSVFACSKKTKEDPLILPPNFAEKPDPNQQEKTATPEQQQENIARLKELLLKNDE